MFHLSWYGAQAPHHLREDREKPWINGAYSLPLSSGKSDIAVCQKEGGKMELEWIGLQSAGMPELSQLLEKE